MARKCVVVVLDRLESSWSTLLCGCPARSKLQVPRGAQPPLRTRLRLPIRLLISVPSPYNATIFSCSVFVAFAYFYAFYILSTCISFNISVYTLILLYYNFVHPNLAVFIPSIPRLRSASGLNRSRVFLDT